MADALDDPKKLWHYTSWRACRAILSPGAGNVSRLWASDLGYMNDSSERHHAIDKLRALLSPDLDKAVGEMLSDAATHFRVHCISFSTESDSLSQWRAYGLEEGPQVAIGFDRDQLVEVTRIYGFKHVKCKYTDAEHDEVLKDIAMPLESAFARANAASPGGRSPDARGILGWPLMFPIPMAAAQIKHEKFSDEQEERLIGPFRRMIPPLKVPPNVHPEAGFHDRRSLVVPHVAVPIDVAGYEFPVNAIRIGPTPHRAELEASVKAWTGTLKRAHPKDAPMPIPDIQVRASSIPFRNW